MATFIKGMDCDKCPGCTDDPCDPSPPAPDAELVCRSSEASKTKCGHPEWPGYESTPPKRYLTLTLSGTIDVKLVGDIDCTVCNSRAVSIYSGTCVYDRDTCTGTDYGQAETTTYEIVDCDTPDGFPILTALCDVQAGPGWNESFSSTVHTITGIGCASGSGGGHLFSGSASATLTDEYTTAMLEDDVSAMLPEFSGDFSPDDDICAGAYYNVSDDELTVTKRRIEYKFILPSLTGFSCYKLTWVERFYPEGGGDPVDTPKSYQWDGIATETEVFTINVPGGQGSTEIEDIVATCDCE